MNVLLLLMKINKESRTRMVVKEKNFRRSESLITAGFFALQILLGAAPLYAQEINLYPVTVAAAGAFFQAEPYHPPLLKGMTIYPHNPFQFDFFVETGDEDLQGSSLETEAMRLIKYFLASLTTPEADMWVNLNPDEPDRIVTELFGRTLMGCDLLAQDYALKQLTSMALSPESEVGKNFWEEVHQRVGRDIDVDLSHKIWIVPERSEIMVHGTQVFVGESRLKVMLEEDYFPVYGSARSDGLDSFKRDEGEALQVNQFVREIVMPAIEHEVNYGRAFAPLRQVLHSLILAVWYKNQLRRSAELSVSASEGQGESTGYPLEEYIDHQKIGGLTVDGEADAQEIYQQYLEVFSDSVNEIIHETYDPQAQRVLIQKYITGGVRADNVANTFDFAMSGGKVQGKMVELQVGLSGQAADREMDRFQILVKNRVVDILKEEGALVVVSDKDDTLQTLHQPISPKTSEEIIKLVRAGGMFVLSTGGSAGRIKTEYIDPLKRELDVQGLSKEERASFWSNTLIIVDNGGAILIYRDNDDQIVGDPFEVRWQARLDSVLSEEKIQSVLKAVDDILEVNKGKLSEIAQSQVYIDRLSSEFRLVFLNNQATPEQRRAFDSKNSIRIDWAKQIQLKLLDLEVSDVLEAIPTGATTINIKQKNVDKGSGLRALAELYDLSFDEMIYLGNEPDGNDSPVFELFKLRKLGVAVNVGEVGEDFSVHRGVLHSPIQNGPGALAFMQTINGVLESQDKFSDQVLAAANKAMVGDFSDLTVNSLLSLDGGYIVSNIGQNYQLRLSDFSPAESRDAFEFYFQLILPGSNQPVQNPIGFKGVIHVGKRLITDLDRRLSDENAPEIGETLLGLGLGQAFLRKLIGLQEDIMVEAMIDNKPTMRDIRSDLVSGRIQKGDDLKKVFLNTILGRSALSAGIPAEGITILYYGEKYYQEGVVLEGNDAAAKLVEDWNRRGDHFPIGYRLRSVLNLGSAELMGSQEYGGIDLNPQNWHVTENGDAGLIPFNFSEDKNGIDWNAVDGLYPFIIQMTPVENPEVFWEPSGVGVAG